MAEVRLKGIVKRFGATTVLRGLDLDVADREFMVLVGPSGCGKSTALRLIAGLDEPDEGTIEIGGRIVNGVPPAARDIAMVFQSYALYPHMSVRGNLEFGLRMRGVPRAERERRVAEVAAVLGLEDLLERRPAALSGGQRQRVAVGRAIVRAPAAFLFDEPLSNLDAKLRTQMRAELATLQRRLAATCIYVTHDQVEAMTMGHRIAVMKDGDIRQVGPPLELYARPADLFVASFLGVPPINLVTATLSAGGDELVADGLRVPVTGSLATALPGRTAVIGIRPEALRAGAGPTALTLEVELVEPLGSDVIVHGRTGATHLVAALGPGVLPRPGDRLPLGLEPSALHFFDPVSERRLTF